MQETAPPSVAPPPFPILGRYVFCWAYCLFNWSCLICIIYVHVCISRLMMTISPCFVSTCRKKRFLFGHLISSCTTNRTTAVIRDERKDRVDQFPLSTTSTSSGILLRISSEDVFGDSGYPRSKEVVWQIELPESRRMVVFFQSFELDRSSKCGDYISIHNENGDLLQFCGEEKIEDIGRSQDYLVGKRITVKFVASASGNGVGFSALLI